MYIIISYDISSDKTRAKVFKFLQDYGIHTQKSVFECIIDNKQIEELESFLQENLDFKSDRCMLIPICNACKNKARLLGLDIKIESKKFVVI